MSLFKRLKHSFLGSNHNKQVARSVGASRRRARRYSRLINSGKSW